MPNHQSFLLTSLAKSLNLYPLSQRIVSHSALINDFSLLKVLHTFSAMSVIGLISTPSFAAIQDVSTTQATAQPSVQLSAVNVTATRLPTLVSNTIAQTEIIDSEELEHYRGQTVLDVIKRQPGINIKQNGGIGTSSNFYMRGYDSKSVLVLIDGVRYSSLSLGTPALNLLPTEQIERIEILYGASGSSIYGSDAVGGVIQIFTKGANVEQSQFSATIGVGSHDQYLYGATAQFTNDSGTSLSLSASHNETDGINATLSTNTFNYHPDDDGFESDSYGLRLTQNVTDNVVAGISGLYNESTTEYDSGNPESAKDDTRADQKNGAAHAFIDWHYAPNSSIKLSYGQSIDESKDYAYDSYYDTKQEQFNIIGSQQVAIGQAIFGAEHLTQSLDSTVDYDQDDRKVNSAFLGYLINNNDYNAQANLRYDDYSDYDSETTYNLGAAVNFGSDFRIGANYAKGYRVPTFNDLYAPKNWGSNPNLVPETSDNYEAFLEYNTLSQSTRLTGYRNDVEDIIVYTYAPTPTNPYAGNLENFDKAKIEGLTLTSDWHLNDYLVGLSYDYQRAKDDSGGVNDSNFLPFRPEHKGLVYLGYQQPNFDIRAEYEYVGDHYSRVTNDEDQKIDNYGLVNLSGNYELTPHVSLNARLNNLLNKEYETDPGYNTDGINYLMALTYTGY